MYTECCFSWFTWSSNLQFCCDHLALLRIRLIPHSILMVCGDFREDASSLMRCEDNTVSYKIREGPALRPFRIPEYVSSPPKTSSPASPSIEAGVSMVHPLDKPFNCQPRSVSLSPVPCNSEELKQINLVLPDEEAVDRIPGQGVPRVATASEGQRWWDWLPSAHVRDPHSVLRSDVGKPELVSRDLAKTVALGLGQKSFFCPMQETHNTDHKVV